LGDPIEATSREPKALDEVVALYAGKDWVNEPGKKWDWSISGFSLLVTVVERVTGESFPDYVQQNIFAPAGVKFTTYCDDFNVVRGLSHAYRRFGAGYEPANEDDMAYNSDLRFCSTVGDLLQLWRAISEKKLVKPETFRQMTTPEGVAMQMSPTDPNAHYGFAISMNQEEDHKRYGQHGSLMGYSGSLYEFPADGLTIVVLTNTEGQNAYAITRALARAVLGLPDLPTCGGGGNSAERVLADKPTTSAERAQVSGTYILKLERLTPQLHDSFAQYRRTYRVFDENGRLMIEALGGVPERLLKQEDGSFAMRTSPRGKVTFVIKDGRAASLTMDGSGLGAPLSGARVGDGDPKTFHMQR